MRRLDSTNTAALTSNFYDADAREVARALLNCHFVAGEGSERVVLRITEVEAYLGVGEDPGSHAFRGKSRRNASMFLPGGHLYVYRSYGVHWCANVVVGKPGSAAAVLVRAGQVLEGVGVARVRRIAAGTLHRDIDLARGPGRTATALGLAGDDDGIDLTTGARAWIEAPMSATATETPVIGTSTRTGVSGAGFGLPFRYFIVDDPTVSPHRPGRLEKTAKSTPK